MNRKREREKDRRREREKERQSLVPTVGRDLGTGHHLVAGESELMESAEVPPYGRDEGCEARDREAPTGVEPVMEVLQTSALPLGYGAERVDSSGGTAVGQRAGPKSAR